MPLVARTAVITAGLLAALLGLLAGCAPEPAPTPTPTPAFASEEEAFAAAEKVYRDYNDAVNAERAGDESADPAQFLTSAALETDIYSRRLVAREGWSLVGDGKVDAFVGTESRMTATSSVVTATVCLDVTGSKVLNSDGDDVTPSDRVTRVLLDIEFVSADDRLLISRTEVAKEKTC
ncbi:hypothetical protein [Microbacterium sp. 1.5R]|uniref:hypothetical protein n=1 Tax=Microbacterium sp. 1.5R TaxID=1916917 RepID=UPI0011A4CC19|nr:hypothetical protein [Microbacterium sp. 1.5R]